MYQGYSLTRLFIYLFYHLQDLVGHVSISSLFKTFFNSVFILEKKTK